LGNPQCQDKNNQPIEMRFLMATRERFAWLHCSVATDALIGCFPIGALYATKLGVIAQGFVWERALRIPDFLRMVSSMPLIHYCVVITVCR
jgi:hypothetical protein